MNDIRRENCNKIRLAFTSDKTLIASEIAERTGLSVVTVNVVLEEMCSTGEIEKAGVNKGKSGRPSISYKYNRQYRLSLINYAYIKGNMVAVRFVVMNRFREEIYERQTEVERLDREFVLKSIGEIKELYPTVKVLILGFPGYETGKAVSSGDFINFLSAKYLEKIEKKYGMRPVFMNDINAAVCGYNKTSEKKYKNQAAVFFPKNYCPGSGIIVDGRIYTGTNNFAGEIGIMPTEIKWQELHKHGNSDIIKQVAWLLLFISCSIAPESIVVYGEYINKKVFSAIEEKLSKKLPQGYMPELILSENFDNDFKNGLGFVAEEELGKED